MSRRAAEGFPAKIIYSILSKTIDMVERKPDITNHRRIRDGTGSCSSCFLCSLAADWSDPNRMHKAS